MLLDASCSRPTLVRDKSDSKPSKAVGSGGSTARGKQFAAALWVDRSRDDLAAAAGGRRRFLPLLAGFASPLCIWRAVQVASTVAHLLVGQAELSFLGTGHPLLLAPPNAASDECAASQEAPSRTLQRSHLEPSHQRPPKAFAGRALSSVHRARSSMSSRFRVSSTAMKGSSFFPFFRTPVLRTLLKSSNV